jgi:prolyl 4-hydroxylase
MINYEEHIFPTESLIGGWYMPKTICDKLIDIFKSNKKEENKIYLNKEDVVDPIVKISLETGIRNEEYEKHLNNILELYKQKYSFCDVGSYGINDLIKIQYYEPNEGFFKWHIENNNKPHNKKRHIVFMTYLNDVKDGGTEFMYQNLISPAKKGLTLFWPAYYTHPHRGQISSKQEKYIATAWYTFNE